MYQIMAKPRIMDRADMMTPAPVFFGMWMGLKPFAGRS